MSHADPGIYLGFVDAPAERDGGGLNPFFKRKTIGQIGRIVGATSDHTVSRFGDQREAPHCIFQSRRDALRWAMRAAPGVHWLVIFEAGAFVEQRRPFYLWLDHMPDAENTSIAAYGALSIAEGHVTMGPRLIAVNVPALRRHAGEVMRYLDAPEARQVKASWAGNDWLAFDPSGKKTLTLDADMAWLAPLIDRGYALMTLSRETVGPEIGGLKLDTEPRRSVARAYSEGRAKPELRGLARDMGERDFLEAWIEKDFFNYDYCLLDNTNDFYLLDTAPDSYEAVVVPAAGWNFLKLAAHLQNPRAEYYHYDVAMSAVDFRKKLIEEWSGRDFATFFERARDEKVFYYGGARAEDADPALWSRVRDSRHHYEALDLLSDWQRLLEQVRADGHKSVLFDITNILSYHVTVYQNGFEKSTAVFKAIVDHLRAGFDKWALKTDCFCLTSQDYARWEREDFLANPVSGGGYGFFVHKTRLPVPVGLYLPAWDNATVNFDLLFRSPKGFFSERAGREPSPFSALNEPWETEALLTEARELYKKGAFQKWGDPRAGIAMLALDGAKALPTFGKFQNRGRIRLLAIEPGGFLTPSCGDAGGEEIHVSLNEPLNSHFHFWEYANLRLEGGYWGVAPFRPGAAWSVDSGLSRLAYNLSNETWFHMIIEAGSK